MKCVYILLFQIYILQDSDTEDLQPPLKKRRSCTTKSFEFDHKITKTCDRRSDMLTAYHDAKLNHLKEYHKEKSLLLRENLNAPNEAPKQILKTNYRILTTMKKS